MRNQVSIVSLFFALFCSSLVTSSAANGTPADIQPLMCTFVLGPIDLTESSGIANDNIFCDNSYANVNATFQSAGTVSTWQWSSNKPSNVSINNANSAYASLYLTNTTNAAISAILTLTATDPTGCSQQKQVTILIGPKLSLAVVEHDNSGTPDDKGICFGDFAEFTSTVTGGIAPFDYKWSHLPSTNNAVSTFQPVWDNMLHVYYLVVTDASGCTITGFESTKGFTQITGNAQAKLACVGDSIQLNVSGGIPSPAGYIFFSMPGTIPISAHPSPFVVPIQQNAGTTKTYSYFAKDEKGCGINISTSVSTPVDADGDGYRVGCDCNDNNPAIFENCNNPAVLTLTCPANQTKTAAQGTTTTVATYANPTTSTTCATTTVTLTRTAGLASGGSFPIGANTVTYRATDLCSQVKTCSFTITVNAPNPAPVLTITCPANQTETAVQGATTASVNYAAAQASSTCATGTVSVTRTAGLASGSNFPIGSNTVTFQAQDGCALTKSCSFNITINAPATNTGCTGNLIKNGDFENNTEWNGLSLTTAQAHAGASSAEICTPGFARIYQNVSVIPGSVYSLSFWTKRSSASSDAIAIKYFAANWTVLSNEFMHITTTTAWAIQNLNTTAPASASFVEISLVKNGATGCLYLDDACFVPSANTGQLTLTCPQSSTQTAPTGASGMVVSYAAATGNTTCPSTGFSSQRTAGLASGTTFPVGTNTVTYAATDACGNAKTCSFTVSVNPAGGGNTGCTNNLLANADFELSAAWSGLSRTTTETHGGLQSAQLCAPGFARIYQNVIVNANQTYTFSIWAKNNGVGSDALVVKYFSSAWAILGNEFKTINSSTAWQEFSLVSTAPAGTAFAEVNIYRSGGTGCLFADDACFSSGGTSNTGVLSLTCPANQTLTAAVGSSTANASFSAAIATTTCPTVGSSVNLQTGLSSGSAFPIGVNTVTYGATDACGNNKTCSFTITVQANGGGNTACTAMTINKAARTITIAGIPSTKIVIIQIVNLANYAKVAECFNTCDKPVMNFTNLDAGVYQVKIDLYDQTPSGWQYLCQRKEDITVTNNLVGNTAFSLAAEAEGTQSKLVWTVQSMGGTQSFFIERSTDGLIFEKIQTVQTDAEKEELLYVEGFDTQPNEGLNFYRIRMVSSLGEERYSPVQSVFFAKNDGVMIYPNPSNGQIFVERTTTETPLQFRLSSATGQLLLQGQLETGVRQSALDLSTLPAGMYFLHTFAESARPVVQRVLLAKD